MLAVPCERRRLYTEARGITLKEKLMGKWNSTIAAVSFLMALTPAHAQEKKAGALTAMDYIEIQQLVNKYGQDIDTCTNKGYDYADLYTTDGIFIDKYSDDGSRRAEFNEPKDAMNSRRRPGEDPKAARICPGTGGPI
jgi:hypothetical protein